MMLQRSHTGVFVMPEDAKEGSDQPASGGKGEPTPSDLVEDASALPKQSRTRGIKVWLADLSQRAFLLTVISSVVSGIVVWFVQDHITEQGRKGKEASLVRSIQTSVASECRRLQNDFANFYHGYPTTTCDINVYRLPKPDPALVVYLNSRREAIVGAMEEKGVALIRSAALAAGAYDRIFSDKYFKSTISRNTTTFDDYFRPLNEMCAIVDVNLSIQQCPYR